MDKIVYIAGAYTGASFVSIEANIKKAERCAIECAKRGIAYFCPHLNSIHFEDKAPEVPQDFYYRMDSLILRKCDALLVLPGWEKSNGTKAEIALAESLETPRFYLGTPEDLGDVEEWYNDN